MRASEAAPASLGRRFIGWLGRGGSAVALLLIALEGLYMTSAFGLYLFSTYAPIQAALERWPATAWLTDFYLWHFIAWDAAPQTATVGPGGSVPTNPFRLNLFANRLWIWFAGFFVFFAGAVPVYWAKLTHRAVVTGGIYRLVRHPQYVGFGVVGIPFLSIWPRVIVLVAYVSMVYFYVLLARREERRCERLFGSSYDSYLQATPSMFIPGDWIVARPLATGFARLVPHPGGRRVVLVLVYALLVWATVQAAYGLKHHAVAVMPHRFGNDVLTIALRNSDRNRLGEVTALALTDVRVRAAVATARQAGVRTLLVYVVPTDGTGAHFFYDNFAATRPREPWSGAPTASYDMDAALARVPRDLLRTVVVWGTTGAPARTAQELLDRVLRPMPLVAVGIDVGSREVLGVVALQRLRPTEDLFRGSRMPLF